MIKKIFLIICILNVGTLLFASTIIVNSVFDDDRSPGSSQAAAAVEDGLMEALFDAGFIMFSIANSSDVRVEGAKDARYMISITPDPAEGVVQYRLQATINGMVILEGSVADEMLTEGRDPDKGDLYFKLGEAVAEKVLQFF